MRLFSRPKSHSHPAGTPSPSQVALALDRAAETASRVKQTQNEDAAQKLIDIVDTYLTSLAQGRRIKKLWSKQLHGNDFCVVIIGDTVDITSNTGGDVLNIAIAHYRRHEYRIDDRTFGFTLQMRF